MIGTDGRFARVVGLVGALALALAACGGDDGGGGGDGADGGPTADAGPPDAPVALGLTAQGVYAGAVATARGMREDAALFEVTSRQISGGGEMQEANAQSFWSYAFVSPSTGSRVNVIYNQGAYAASTGTINPDGLLTIADQGWPDSDVALEKAAAAGFVAPGAGDANTELAMKLSPEMLLDGVPGPHWEIEKITAPPGGEVAVERWFVVFVEAQGMYAVCPPMADQCDLVP